MILFSFSRADQSALAEWWWTVDRSLLTAVLILSLFGLICCMAASPPVAIKLGLGEFHFVKRQVLFFLVGLFLMIGVSLLDLRQLRRVSLIFLCVSMILSAYALLYGDEIKGARRWVAVFGFSLQPSEFIKPFFVLLSAWLLAEGVRRPEMPAIPLSVGLLGVLLFFFLQQPDVGQAVLIFLVWSGLFFIAGMRVFWTVMLMGLCIMSIACAYFFIPHVTSRIDRFLDPASGDTYQVDKALESVARGGWLGQGPGEGQVKHILPDSHTDFIFATTAEEFGVFICLLLLAMFTFVVLRVLFLASCCSDLFVRFAMSGLVTLFGLQALINMGVNLALLPAKGMTLPFISAGGSSAISTFLLMGMILGLARHSPPEDTFFLDCGPGEESVGGVRSWLR